MGSRQVPTIPVLKRTRAAGGSGNGAVRALSVLEYYFKRLGCEIVDLVPATKFSRDHKYRMLEEAGE